MLAAKKCLHQKTQVTAAPTYYEEDDVVILTVSMKCLMCGTRFKFRGMSSHLSADAPSTNGFIAALPMVEDSPRLLS